MASRMTWDKLRAWQKRFAEKFASHVGKNFLLVVLPAGGKTIAALWVANEWLHRTGVKPRRLIYVSPLYDLKRQFRNEARANFGLEFQTDELGDDFKPGFDGACLTYQGMAAAAAVLRALCSRYEIFVIFDEPHHLSEEAAWGRACKHAFEAAFQRLFMTGTPWRTDCDDIPFLERDEEGNYVIHDRYDWPLALEEEEPPGSGMRCIRILTFRTYDDVVDCERDNELFTLDSRANLSHDDQDRWLRGAIRGRDFRERMIRDAHDQLMKIRMLKPDAAGLVVCEGIDEASRMAQTVQQITGIRPYLIVSDEERAAGDDIDAFNKKNGIWIVSVRKVSEGISIKRLMIALFLTNYTTELYFRQLVGRVMRSEGTDFDREAYVYMPNHYLLVEYAKKIEELQAVALRKRNGNGPPPPPGLPTTYCGDRDAELSGIIVPASSGRDAAHVEAEQINLFMEQYRHLGATETLAAQLIHDEKWAAPPSKDKQEPEPESMDDQPLEVRLNYWRKINENKLRQLVILRGERDNPRFFLQLRMEVNAHMGVRDIRRATVEQLKKGCAYLDELMQAARAGTP